MEGRPGDLIAVSFRGGRRLGLVRLVLYVTLHYQLIMTDAKSLLDAAAESERKIRFLPSYGVPVRS
jgi:hypothetical protein